MTHGKYRPGALAEIIAQSSNKKTNDVERRKEKAKLASLFSPEISAKQTVSKISSKRKATDDSDDTLQPTTGEGYGPPPDIVHESLLKKKKKTSDEKLKPEIKEPKTEKKKGEESAEESKKISREKQRKNRKKISRDKTLDSKTVFVGNWPVSLDKKNLKKLFKTCGKIQSVRFRCPPPKDPRVPKKVISIKKEFHPERPTIIGFVCFEEEKDAQKALKLNGREMDGHHIRVDLASNSTEHNHRCSIFVGNLPFTIDEEKIRQHFLECGEIVSVRIVHDNKTGLGKGFCYVLFKSPDGVGFAVHKNGKTLEGRELRVVRSQENPAKKKNKFADKKVPRSKISKNPHSGKETTKKSSDNFNSKKTDSNPNKYGHKVANKTKSSKQVKKDKKFKKAKTKDAQKIKKNKALFKNSFKNSRESQQKYNKKGKKGGSKK